MRLPQELVDHIIDCFSGDGQMLLTCSLVTKAWLARSRRHLFNKITLNGDRAKKWCSTFRPGQNGVSNLVRTLRLQQTPQGHPWLDTKSLDAISDHFSSFQYVENLSFTGVDLSSFEPGSLARNFLHHGPSLRSLDLFSASANYSALSTFLQLFPNLKVLYIHDPTLCDDNPPLSISRTAPIFHGSLKLSLFNSVSSPFISHLAGLDLRFSTIFLFRCDFSSGLPLTNLLEASALSLRRLQLDCVTFSECANVSLMRCEILHDVIVGAFGEDRPPLLLFSLLSTLSSIHIARFTINFTAIPGPHWPHWKATDTHLVQMAERCNLQRRPQVVLYTKFEAASDIVDGRQLLPKYWEVGPVELKFQSRHHRGDR